MTVKTLIQNISFKEIFEYASLVVILSYVAVFSIGTSEYVDKYDILKHLEYFLLVCFTVEYVMRIWKAPILIDGNNTDKEKRYGYIVSFYGIIDFVAIISFYLSLLIPEIFASASVVRMISIIRLLKVSRYCEQPIDDFVKAFNQIKKDLGVFFIGFIVLLFLSATIVYWAESKSCPDPNGESVCSVFDGLWWAVVTLTTVGYGDIKIMTLVGKVFTFIVLLLGMGMIAIPAALFTAAYKDVLDNRSDK